LGRTDFGGYALVSDVLVGSFGGDWVGGVRLDTFKPLWWKPARTDLTAPPSVFGGAVVLGFRDGALMKVDASTGKLAWEARLPSFADRSMTLSGKTLLVSTADQTLMAFDFSTGQPLWNYDAGRPEGLALRSAAPPLVNGGLVFYGTSAGDVHAIALETGKLAWQYSGGFAEARFHDVVGALAVFNNMLLVTRNDGVVVAVDFRGEERAKLWEARLSSVTSSDFHDGRIYVGGFNGDVIAIDAMTGQQLWRVQTGQPIGALTIADRRLFSCGSNGRVTAIDLISGRELWHDNPGEDISRPPLVAQGNIYIPTGLGNLYVYRL
jgi:outer membrane protein assembly factor BamB